MYLAYGVGIRSQRVGCNCLMDAILPTPTNDVCALIPGSCACWFIWGKNADVMKLKLKIILS